MSLRTSTVSAVVAGCACFAAGLWFGASPRVLAEPGALPAAASRGSQGMRYMLESGSDSMCMIDTWTGDTWTLAPAGTDGKTLHRWTKFQHPEPSR